MSNTQGSFKAKFEVDGNHLHSEECNANKTQLDSIDRHSGEQVRIEFHAADPNANLGAIFTVSEPPFLDDHDLERVIIGKRIVNLNNCQLSENACKGEVSSDHARRTW